MYRNRMQFCGNLVADPKIFEPRKDGDKIMFAFTVCQTVKKKDGESRMFLDCETRLEPSRAAGFRKMLVKGAFIDIEGPLVITRKEDGKVFVHVNTTTAQFPPRQSATEGRERPAPAKPAIPAAQAAPDAFNPARFADED